MIDRPVEVMPLRDVEDDRLYTVARAGRSGAGDTGIEAPGADEAHRRSSGLRLALLLRLAARGHVRPAGDDSRA